MASTCFDLGGEVARAAAASPSAPPRAFGLTTVELVSTHAAEAVAQLDCAFRVSCIRDAEVELPATLEVILPTNDRMEKDVMRADQKLNLQDAFSYEDDIAVQAAPISTAPAKDSMDANVSAPPQTAVAKEAELCDEICVAGPAGVEKVKTTETEENKENHQDHQEAKKAEGVVGFLAL